MTNIASRTIRNRLRASFDGLPVPKVNETSRVEGTNGFSMHWCVRGTPECGVVASYGDVDDVIEFGLLERESPDSVNIMLHVTIVLDDVIEMNSISESELDLNFDTYLNEKKTEPLNRAIAFFAKVLLAT